MKEKKILFVTGIILLFFMSVGLSYSYFTIAVNGNETAKDMVVETGTLKLEYTDGPEIIAKSIQPGWKITKTITVENTGTLDAIYNLKWKELTNTITNDELLYDLDCESNIDTCSYINTNINEPQPVPSSPDIIMGDIIIYPKEKQTISLTFTFKETNKDQNYNQGKKFNGVLNIEETTTTRDNEYTMYAHIINTNNEPIANTIIELQNESKTGTTDNSGYVMIDAVKPGSHTLLIKDNSGNILDTRRVLIEQKKESDVLNNKTIYTDITLSQFTTTIVLNNSNKIEKIDNLIIPPDSCFTVSNNGITEYDPNNNEICPKELIIPNKINNTEITKISCEYDIFSGECNNSSFRNKNLKKVIIQDGITTIDQYSFLENQITSLTLPNSITEIGGNAFSYNKLTSITIPSSLTTIGVAVFSNNCLKSLTIPTGVTTIDRNAFYNNKLRNLTIPKTVTTINEMAFNNNLLPEDQAYIYKRNDDGSEDKTNVIGYGGSNKNPIIPNNIITIGYAAFESNELVGVTIPETVTTIENSAFSNNELTEIIIPNTITSMSEHAFSNNKLISVTISNSLTTISGGAFSNNKLTKVTIPDSITSIGSSAFMNNKLTSITIPKNVTLIDGQAFMNNKLTKVTIPNSVLSINYRAFQNNEITNLVIPKGVTKIADEAFQNNKLTNLVIPNTVTSIGEMAFNNNLLPDEQAFIYSRSVNGSEIKTNLIGYGGANKNPIIPDTVIYIGKKAFDHSEIASVTIPEGVVSIGEKAFIGNKLTTVTIPKSVESLYSYAFAGNRIQSVIIKGKTKSSEFTTYNPSWGWLSNITCQKNNTENVTNGCITWGAN